MGKGRFKGYVAGAAMTFMLAGVLLTFTGCAGDEPKKDTVVAPVEQKAKPASK
jgi:hypothetical protein